MKQWIKVLQIFFMALGVIFFIVIILSAYVFIADPFHLKPLYQAFFLPSAVTSTEVITNSNTAKTKNPLLTPAQEQALTQAGIDPAKLPTTITPKMEECFVTILGQRRVDEINSGSAPTFGDFFAARTCL